MTLEVRVVADQEQVTAAAHAELRAALAEGGRPLVGLATGRTFTAFLKELGRLLATQALAPEALLVTHLDEYLGCTPATPGGMVHELLTLCPPLRELLQRRAFLPVPSGGGEPDLAAHARRLEEAGGVALQFAGIGANGHVAFHEPGTPLERGFHKARLAETTRVAARERFAPREVPRFAVTTGVRDLLRARRLVLCATGAHKADAVRRALLGEVSAACPASAVRLHGQAVVILDRAAARGAALRSADGIDPTG